MASKMGIKKCIYECFVCSVQILLKNENLTNEST